MNGNAWSGLIHLLSGRVCLEAKRLEKYTRLVPQLICSGD